jgi:hypothetical protein
MFEGAKERLALFRAAEYAALGGPHKQLLATGSVATAFAGRARAMGCWDQLPPLTEGPVRR